MDYKVQEKSFSSNHGQFTGSYVIRENRNILVIINLGILRTMRINTFGIALRKIYTSDLIVKCNGKEYCETLDEYDIFTKKYILKTIKDYFTNEEKNAIIEVVKNFYKRLNLIQRIGL